MSNATGSELARAPQDGDYYAANLAVSALGLAMVNSVFAPHCYVKLRIRRTPMLCEDWFCLAAWVMYNILIAFTIREATHFGEGRNVWDLSLAQYKNFLRSFYVSSIVYTPAAFCTKVTLLLLISRVLVVKQVAHKCIRIFIVILFLAYAPLLGLKTFTCNPISDYWNISSTAGVVADNPNCLDQSRFFMGDIIIAIVTDFVILLVPIPLVWSMEASRRQKIKIIILLGAGGAAATTTVVRVYLNTILANSRNVSRDFAPITMTSILEVAIGFVCACLPSVNLLFERWARQRAHNTEVDEEAGNAAQSGMASRKHSTSSSYWSSIRSRIVVSTTRTLTRTATVTTTMTANDGRRHRRVPDDIEMMAPSSQIQESVVFNKRLDVPSIASQSMERRSCEGQLEEQAGGLSVRNSTEIEWIRPSTKTLDAG